MKTIHKDKLTFTEEMEITLQGKDPKEYVALDIVAMGLQMTPNVAKVKETEDSDIAHKCIVCTMPFPLPLDSSVLTQKKLIVPTMGAQNGTLELALGGIPKIRIIMKKDAIAPSLKEPEIDSE